MIGLVLARGRRRAPFAALAVVAALASGCSATVGNASPAPSTDTAVATTTPTGSTEELLVQLAAESVQLSPVMAADGDASAALARILAVWDTVRADVVATRPDLVDAFDRAIELSQRAVQFSRAADADKAAKNIDVLVMSFLA